MAEARHFCPKCGSISVIIHGLAGPDGSKQAECPDCGWTGSAADTIGAVSSEKMHDIEDLGEELLQVAAGHAAGPLIRVLEKRGLVEEDDAQGKDYILKVVLEAVVTSVFTAAAENYARKQVQDGKH